MQDKNSKVVNPNPTNAKTEQDQGFALFRSDTIQLWSWLEGYQPLDEQSLKGLSEDISYRIRDSLDTAVSFMHHCKRSELKTKDVNKAFQMLNIEKTFGYENKEPLKYQAIKTDNLNDKVLNQFKSKFYELKDPILDLKLPGDNNDESKIHKNSLHANWFVINGNSFDYRTSNPNSNLSLDIQIDEGDENEEIDIENEIFFAQINQEYKEYYNMVTSVILGDHDCPDDDDKMLNMVLEDFRTNDKLQPVLPYLVNFFHQTIQALTISNSNSINQIICIEYLDRVLEALKNLILNKNTFLAPKGFFSKILSSLLFTTLQNSNFDSNSLRLREKSSFILVMFLKLYQRFSIETIKYILSTFFKPRLSINSLENKHLLSLFGIVSSLKNFGGQLMDQFYEQLIKIALETEKIDNSKSELSLILNREILMCLLVHFRWVLRKSLIESNAKEFSFGKILFLYKNLSNLYGDGFINQILSAHDLWRFKNYFNLKLKIRSHESERFTIKFRNGIFFENCKTESLSEIFDNYKQIKRDIRINYGNSRVVKSKFKFENEVLMEKTNNSLLIVKFKPVGEIKIKTDLESNLNYFYKDSFL